jgi:hypothetical protein
MGRLGRRLGRTLGLVTDNAASDDMNKSTGWTARSIDGGLFQVAPRWCRRFSAGSNFSGDLRARFPPGRLLFPASARPFADDAPHWTRHRLDHVHFVTFGPCLGSRESGLRRTAVSESAPFARLTAESGRSKGPSWKPRNQGSKPAGCGTLGEPTRALGSWARS